MMTEKELLQQLIEEYNLAIVIELDLRKKLSEEEMKKTVFEADLWLNTDFGKVITGRNNEGTRKAYVNKQMSIQFIDKTAGLSADLNFVQKYIKYISKKINVILQVGAYDGLKTLSEVVDTSMLAEKFPSIVKEFKEENNVPESGEN